MKTIRLSTKIIVGFCGILLIVITLVASYASARQVTQPTLQDVLDAIAKLPPVWYQILPSDQRFLLVMDGAAVLDKETGLVWEQAPTRTMSPSWAEAVSYCYNLNKAGRMGWHLPKVEQLASLMDLSQNDRLPAGHPFSVDSSNFYWSATTYEAGPDFAWVGDFYAGGFSFPPKASPGIPWCVRGGQGVNPQ